jgi:hypothetical protein
MWLPSVHLSVIFLQSYHGFTHKVIRILDVLLTSYSGPMRAIIAFSTGRNSGKE